MLQIQCLARRSGVWARIGPASNIQARGEHRLIGLKSPLALHTECLLVNVH